jgi:Ca-activated chloride channel family protein
LPPLSILSCESPLVRRTALLLLAASLAACKCGSSFVTPAAPPVEVRIAYGSEKKTWLEEQAKAFLGTKTKSGRAIRLEARAMGSGEAVQGILDGSLRPHVFSPASGAYVALLNQRWLGTAGRTKPISPAGDPVVLSPVVIAMWKPMAEALGWPQKQLGWADLLRVAHDPKGWAGHGHPESPARDRSRPCRPSSTAAKSPRSGARPTL